ncbi:hypothetical protein DRW41_10165 [Neobacillus piezotolerans]|uniref:Uncharacterized protein n=1 Tax=Neobacillus piezotolerans TaxID=2259171 RepID=A0A3D8GRD2_9BACI|nr:hypothetical protein [Neobacillus piezotolerans]RDU37043.1 hypothetical protein DRW41_10165 [Neobacillus piezotolerans]
MEHDTRLKNIKIGLSGNGVVPISLDAGLVTGSHPLSQWMADKFNHNFDEYDKAIDSVYNQTHVGGSHYHHLLDGQHDILGAFRAAGQVKADDSFVREILEAGEHLFRDTMSVSGINPFFSLTGEQFDKLAEIAQSFGISKPFLADALTVNGPELLGGIMAILSSVILGKKLDPSRISKLSGAYICSSLASGNPFLFPIAAGGLVYSIIKAEDKKAALIQGGKGAIVSGGALLVGGIVGGPVWIGCIASVAAAVALNYAIDDPKKTFERMHAIIKPAASTLRRVSLSL